MKAIEGREGIGLRADREWVEALLADPDSVFWDGVPVTPDELAVLVEERLDQAVLLRASLELPSDEATVRALLLSPTTRLFQGIIPMSPQEFAAFTGRGANIDLVGPVVRHYGEEHPDEWAGYYVDDDTGVVVALFTGRVDDHRRAIEALLPPGQVRFDVRAARWTLRQLKAVERRIRGGSDWFRQKDLTIEGWGIRESENLVVIDAIVPAPDPSLEARIIDHFDAEGMLRVAIEVIPTVDFSDAGALVVKVRDTNGRDTDGVHCWLQSDERVTAGEADVMVLDGSCVWEVVKPVAVRVTIWRHFQAGYLGEIKGAVRPGATTNLEITVTLP